MNADSCPFAAGSMLTEDQFFVGRQEALDFITSRMAAAQPTSINVVGEKRIGKSSLLWHFCRTYEQRVQKYGRQASEFVVVYLSLQNARCHSENNFYQVIAEKLLERPSVQGNLALTEPLRQQPMDKVNFSRAMDKWKEARVLPVICLDDFKISFQHRQEFNDYFYYNLRSLMDSSALMLIIASEKKLTVYSKQHRLIYNFFTLGAIYPLKELTSCEASDLVRLPKTNCPNREIALSDRRQELALKWGNNHPYLLQLAAVYLWDAKRLDKSEEWAKAEFDKMFKNVIGRRIRPRWWLPLRWIFHDLPIGLVRLSEKIGNGVNRIIAIGIGFFLILWFWLAVFGQVPLTKVPDGVRQFVCSSLGSALGKFCQ